MFESAKLFYSRTALNPYLGTNVQMTGGPVMYITHKGIAKPYLGTDTTTRGTHGCPLDITPIDIPWKESYWAVNSIIPIHSFHFQVGTPMTPNQSCGLEGTNVWVTSSDKDESAHFVTSALNANSNSPTIIPITPSMISASGQATLSPDLSPQQVLIDSSTGWQSPTTYDPSTGIYNGNTSTPTTVNNMTSYVYGEYIQFNFPSPIVMTSLQITTNSPATWAPNTFSILSSSTGIDRRWTLVSSQTLLTFDGGVPKVIPIDNTITPATHFRIIIAKVGTEGQTTGRDRTQINFLRWTGFYVSPSMISARTITQIPTPWTWQQCLNYAQSNHASYFSLNSDGQCFISNSIDTATQYGNFRLDPNRNYPNTDDIGQSTQSSEHACIASCDTTPGCVGATYDTTSHNCWLKSKLTESEGVVAPNVNTFWMTTTGTLDTDGHRIGTATSHQIYQTKPKGLIDNVLGKLGYVSSDTNLSEYSSTHTLGDKYSLLKNTDYNQTTSDLDSIIANTTIDSLKHVCSQRPDCNGFTFNKSQKTGQLKSSHILTDTPQTNSLIDTYLRQPNSIIDSVPLSIINPDQWNHYNKSSSTPQQAHTSDTWTFRSSDNIRQYNTSPMKQSIHTIQNEINQNHVRISKEGFKTNDDVTLKAMYDNSSLWVDQQHTLYTILATTGLILTIGLSTFI